MAQSRGVKCGSQAPLAANRRYIHDIFGNAEQWDAQEFAHELLDRACLQERLAGREVAWNQDLMDGVCRATHLDRIFSFAVEERRRCTVCGNCRASVQKERSFHVDAVGAGGQSSSVCP